VNLARSKAYSILGGNQDLSAFHVDRAELGIGSKAWPIDKSCRGVKMPPTRAIRSLHSSLPLSDESSFNVKLSEII